MDLNAADNNSKVDLHQEFNGLPLSYKTESLRVSVLISS